MVLESYINESKMTASEIWKKHCDILGILRMSSLHLSTLEKEMDIISKYLPIINNCCLLSRGERYYDIKSAVDDLPELTLISYETLMQQTKHILFSPSITAALIENVLNILMAVTYAFWEHCTDFKFTTDFDAQILDRLIENSEKLASVHIALLYSLPYPKTEIEKIDWDFISHLPNLIPKNTVFRCFREVDNKFKILDEILFTKKHITLQHDIKAVVFPLYGAQAIGTYWAGYQRLMRLYGDFSNQQMVFYIRIGFYDQSSTSFFGPHGEWEYDKIIPRKRLKHFSESIQGMNTLIIDDNFGRGNTFAACRKLIKDLGGRPFCRSLETSWTLFEHSGCNEQIRFLLDFPSLRSYFHHSKQKELIDLILQGKYKEYRHNIEQLNLPNLNEQLALNMIKAKKLNIWSKDQLILMDKEIREAEAYWLESGYPEKQYQEV
ncbi:phosphoribosyltransferase [Paenibacillus xylanexedens]|uniref:phosphoribosyltransferase n=1 Tax=Paenibacillus xylanexedens TaxID=528191 RepID=UPI000F541108|nr:phosphoribosyltransferase [Paenibacillus xylanexedens]RPK27806.1 hypothetical protein EDO6_03329 [Paenibacillus xylanexedens]